MLLSTMSYEEMYLEILKDIQELSNIMTNEEKNFRKLAKRAKMYPYGRIYNWKHPISLNKYTFFFDVKSHSEWDKAIRTVIFTECNTNEGRITISISLTDGSIGINIFSPHFFKRYDERHLSLYTQFTPKRKHDIRIEFFLRTTIFLHMGNELSSLKELEKNEPDVINEALLTTEGLLLCKRLKENPNILIYKTYIGAKEFVLRQYEKVTLNMIHVYYLRAKDDSPKFLQSIDKLYIEGINDLNKLWNDPNLPFEEKQELRYNKLMEVLDHLCKYFV